MTVVLAALACAVELGLSGAIGLRAVTVAMVRVHVVIGLVEAAITVFLIELFKEKPS
jgi:cobalt/nickel transport system permease protein